VEKPYRNLFEKRMILFTSIVTDSLFEKDLKKAINRIAGETKSDITVYDIHGKVIISSSEKTENLTEKLIKKVEKNGSYREISRIKNRIFFLTTVNKPPGRYMSISADTDDGRRNKFFLWLIFLCILLSLLIYPLSMNITRPLERITEKAIKFSHGDFSVFAGNNKKQNGDEIARLDNAFNHMARELIAMIEAKKELLSDISHELGSPLARMKVALEMIQDKIEKSKVPSMEHIKSLSDDIDEMSELVKELLEFSKMDLKNYMLNIKPLNIEELVSISIKNFENLGAKKNITMELKKEGEIHDIPSDGEKICRVLANLLSNAIKYSQPGGKITIIVRGEKEFSSVSVIDDGPGIGKENGEKIFEPFFREDPSRTRGTGGTGLGLAIAKKIIDLHGGKIWVENPGEHGAIITFQIYNIEKK
jgi:signal transduction histidine kinase